MVQNSIWISWENQRRNRELSNVLKIPIFEFGEIDDIENYLKKYIVGIVKTFFILLKTRPKIVICQNPSIVLSLFILTLKAFSNIRVVLDAHNAGLFPLDGCYKILNWLSRIIQRYADLTIVTNEGMKKHVIKNGGRAFVLQDKIPKLIFTRIKKLRGKYNILFICTYADDEPFEIVIEAAKIIEKNIFIYFTGNYKKKGINQNELPENVILTGYIPESEYVSMIYSVDATIDLTKRENCLVCGAYESLAAGKPMILSKTQALMEYFNKGAVYVEHDIYNIANGIKEVIRRKKELSEQIKELKKIRNTDWQAKKVELEKILSDF